MLHVKSSLDVVPLCTSATKQPYEHVRIDWFSTLAHARALAKPRALPNLRSLEVRCTVPEPKARETARKMMQIVAATKLERLRITLPAFETDIGAVHAKATVAMLELVDRTQTFPTVYSFRGDALQQLSVAITVPGKGSKVLGATPGPGYPAAILKAASDSLASLSKGAVSTISIAVKPKLTKPEHKEQIATIAARFDATLL